MLAGVAASRALITQVNGVELFGLAVTQCVAEEGTPYALCQGLRQYGSIQEAWQVGQLREVVSVAEADRPVFGVGGVVKKGRILILWVSLLFTRNPKENKDASEERSCVVFRVVR